MVHQKCCLYNAAIKNDEIDNTCSLRRMFIIKMLKTQNHAHSMKASCAHVDTEVYVIKKEQGKINTKTLTAAHFEGNTSFYLV